VRIVADTNTVVSGLLWQGAPRRLIDASRAQQLTLITSPALLAELAEVLARNKFAARILQAGVSAKALVEDYAEIAHVIVPEALQVAISRDPDDDEVLACAITAQVDAIVSGDADLLILKNFYGMPILSANQAVKKLQPEP
jgi:putative PIN family toxin of toxin-antitoxin system